MHNWTSKNESEHEKIVPASKNGSFSFGIGSQYTNTVVA